MSSGAPPPEAPPPDVPPPDVAPPVPPPRRRVWPPDRELWPWLLALLLLVIGGVIAAILLTGGNGSKKHAGPGTGTIVNTKRGTVLVPSVLGMTQAEATRKLEDLGLTAQARQQASRRAAGAVLAQTPAAGTRLPRGRLVGLTVSSGPPRSTVPNVVGLTAAAAATKLEAGGLRATTRQALSRKTAGTVVAQTPAAGSTVTRGGTVALTVSKGPANVTVPDVTGLQRAQGVRKVRAAGLTPNVLQVPSTENAGTIVSQSPTGGSTAQSGSSVRLNVAKGTTPPGNVGTPRRKPAAVTVPNVVGKQQAAAQRTLVNAGLRSRVTYVSSQQPEGTVISQSPRAGSKLVRRSRVALKVSTGPGSPQETAVPDVIGQNQSTAQTELQDAGFDVQVIEQKAEVPQEKGLVLDQDPAGGTRAPKGATVTIFVGR